MQGILISVRHKWAEKIYRKEKLYDLRRTAPRREEFLAQPWRPVYIYEPEARAVTGIAGFGGEFSSDDAEQMAMLPLSLRAEEIRPYLAGRDGLYHAWRLEGAERYLEPMPLWQFFATVAGPGCEALKLPPRSWQYIHIDRGRL